MGLAIDKGRGGVGCAYGQAFQLWHEPTHRHKVQRQEHDSHHRKDEQVTVDARSSRHFFKGSRSVQLWPFD